MKQQQTNMAARRSVNSPEKSQEDGEQRREIRRKYRDLIQDLQGIVKVFLRRIGRKM